MKRIFNINIANLRVTFAHYLIERIANQAILAGYPGEEGSFVNPVGPEDTTSHGEALFSPELLEALFLYAYRRTGQRDEAEDLAQEIVLEALSSLAQGATPRRFHAWLWSIARRRYSRWVEGQRLRRIGAAPTPRLQRGSRTVLFDDDPSLAPDPEEQALRSAEARAVIVELSRLSESYRSIAVLHYIHGRGLKEVAASLGIPEGTVKRRLHEARLIIKRGMLTVKTPTTRSYDPDILSLVMNGNNTGAVWPYMRRLLSRNVLSAASDAPVSISELANQLGLPSAYVEDEVKLLVEATLLIPKGRNTFQTGFIVIDHDQLREIESKTVDVGRELADRFAEALSKRRGDLLRFGYYGAAFPWETQLWMFLLMMIDQTVRRVSASKREALLDGLKPYEKGWYVIGTRLGTQASTNRSAIRFYGCDNLWVKPSHGDRRFVLTNYYNHGELPSRMSEIDENDVRLIVELWEREGDPAHLNETGKERAAELIVRAFLRRHGSAVLPNVTIFTAEQHRGVTALLDEIIEPHISVGEALWEYAQSELIRRVRRDLVNQLPNLLDVKMGGLRHGVIQHLIDTGQLQWPERPNEPAASPATPPPLAATSIRFVE